MVVYFCSFHWAATKTPETRETSYLPSIKILNDITMIIHTAVYITPSKDLNYYSRKFEGAVTVSTRNAITVMVRL